MPRISSARFYQPAGVWIDTESLRTLPDRELQCGLAEVVKYGVILDGGFFDSLEREVEKIMARDHDAHCGESCSRAAA